MNRFLIPEPKERRSGGTLFDLQLIQSINEIGYNIKIHWVAKNTGVKSLITDFKKEDILIIDGLVFHQNYKDANFLEGYEKIYITHLPFWLEPGISDNESEIRKLRELNYINKCKIVVCTSNYIYAILINNGISNEKIKIINPRIPFQPEIKMNYKEAPKELLVVGGVHFGKGLDILVKALGHLKNSNWTLKIAGDFNPNDSYFESINREIENLELSSKIRFLGECNEEQITELYKNSDLLIHPSRFESYGMAVGEALCFGLPVLASDAGALPSVYNETPVRFFKSEDISSLIVLLHSTLNTKEYEKLIEEFGDFIFNMGSKNEPDRNINGVTKYLR